MSRSGQVRGRYAGTRSRRWGVWIVALVIGVATVVVAVLVSAESPDSETVQVADRLPRASVDAVDIPEGVAAGAVYRLPWEAAPKSAQGLMLGLGEHEGRLRFTAVAADGTELWHTHRPLACSGFTVTVAAGRALAVLNDSDAHEGSLRATASAFDLRTGERVWGPVDVPGPNYGPGLVYGGALTNYAGDPGPMLALDARTGAVRHVEDTSSGQHLVGEFDGALVLADDSGVHGHVAETGERWTLAAAALPWPPEKTTVLPGADPGGRWAVLAAEAHPGILIDTTTGRVHATRVGAVVGDPATGRVAATIGDELSLVSRSRTIWRRPAAKVTPVALSRSGLVVRRGDDRALWALKNGRRTAEIEPDRLVPVADETQRAHRATVLAGEDTFVLAVRDR